MHAHHRLIRALVAELRAAREAVELWQELAELERLRREREAQHPALGPPGRPALEPYRWGSTELRSRVI